jgi:phage shock protein A
MNNRNLIRQYITVKSEINDVLDNYANYAENLEDIINKLDKEIQTMSERIIELEKAYIDLQKQIK